MTESLLTKAIANVMKEVKRQGAKDENKFGNYKYTSVDDYKDHLRPLLGMQGLAVHCDQTGFCLENVVTSGKGGDKNTLAARYDFEITLSHVSGERAESERITVMLPFVGAQTTGQARSYALKEWAKSRFWATSGNTTESDPDALEQMEYRERKGVDSAFTKKAMDPLSEPGGPSARAAKTPFDSLMTSMAQLDHAEDFPIWWEQIKPTRNNQLPGGWAKRLFIETMKSLCNVADSPTSLTKAWTHANFRAWHEQLRKADEHEAAELDKLYINTLEGFSTAK